MDIKKDLPGIQENILLKDYTTFKIGGKAKYFFEAKGKEELIKAILVARKFKLPFFILGGGSNILVSDRGFKGIVIKCQMSNVKCQNQNSKLKTIYAEAGTPLAFLVSMAVKKWWTGLEWAIGIPGTIGGAIYGNAGAFGKSIGDTIKSVEILKIPGYKIPNSKFQIPNKFQIPKFKTKILKNKDCKFSYRDSVFKQNNNLVVLSAEIQLKKGKKLKIQKKIKEYLNYRRKTQPLNFPSAGSVFKNPSGFSAGELSEEDKSSSLAFAAARLIEECGLKGKMIGKAKISEKHANFIVNLGRAKAKDVKRLINLIKKKVKKNFGIILEEEIQYLGFKK